MAQEHDREPCPSADAKGAAVVWCRPEAPGLSSAAQSATQDGDMSPAMNASHSQEASNADLESAGKDRCGAGGSGQGEGPGLQRTPAICVWGGCDVQGLLRITVVLDSPRTMLRADLEGEGLWTKVADAMGLGLSSVGALVSGLAHMPGSCLCASMPHAHHMSHVILSYGVCKPDLIESYGVCMPMPQR